MIPLERKPENGVAPKASSLLDELRAVYDAIDSAEVQTEVFDVEGSHAAVRYRRLRIEDRLRLHGGEGKMWENAAQFLIEACVEILARDPDTGDLEPVMPETVVTFDWRPDSTSLADALGRPEADVRRSVLRLFQGVDDALVRHAEQVDVWMAHARERAGEEFAGK